MTFDTELELVQAVIRNMPNYIQSVAASAGNLTFYIRNETNPGENFAERWNQSPSLARIFFAWHDSALRDIPGFASSHGLDQVEEALSRAFGTKAARRATSALEGTVSSARGTGALGAQAGIGLTTGAAASTQVKANTFYGR